MLWNQQVPINLYLSNNNNFQTHVDAWGLLSFGQLFSTLPILGTIYNLLSDPEGMHPSDYKIDISPEICRQKCPLRAESECRAGITLQGSVYLGQYAALTGVGHLWGDMAGLLVSVLKWNPIWTGVFAVDTYVNFKITLDKMAKIKIATQQALERCKCDSPDND